MREWGICSMCIAEPAFTVVSDLRTVDQENFHVNNNSRKKKKVHGVTFLWFQLIGKIFSMVHSYNMDKCLECS